MHPTFIIIFKYARKHEMKTFVVIFSIHIHLIIESRNLIKLYKNKKQIPNKIRNYSY